MKHNRILSEYSLGTRDNICQAATLGFILTASLLPDTNIPCIRNCQSTREKSSTIWHLTAFFCASNPCESNEAMHWAHAECMKSWNPSLDSLSTSACANCKRYPFDNLGSSALQLMGSNVCARRWNLTV